jgi:hypothetical protein
MDIEGHGLHEDSWKIYVNLFVKYDQRLPNTIIRKVIIFWVPCYDNLMNMIWILLTNITTRVFFNQTQRLFVFFNYIFNYIVI